MVKYQTEVTELKKTITELKYSILTLKLGGVSHLQSNDTFRPVLTIMIDKNHTIRTESLPYSVANQTN